MHIPDMKTLRELADRSGFTLEKTEHGYRIREDDTNRLLRNRDGSEWHRTREEIYESLTERS